MDGQSNPTKAPSSTSTVTMEAANLVPAKASPSEAALFWVSGTSELAGLREWMAGPSFPTPEQPVLPPPSSPERANDLYRTRLCVYNRDTCPDAQNCQFAHSQEEIRLPTRLIDGFCKYGSGCQYGARCFYRLCVSYCLEATWNLIQLIGYSTFNDEERRLSLYAAMFLPLRKIRPGLLGATFSNP